MKRVPLAVGIRLGQLQASLLRAQEGITLLEMVIVVFLLAIFSALVVAAVTGRSVETRGSVVINDLKEVQQAVDGFAAAHPAGRYPTQDGCLPGEIFIAPTAIKEGACEKGPNPGPFNVNDSATWRAILWERGFKTSRGRGRPFDVPPGQSGEPPGKPNDVVVKTFAPHFLQQPAKHAFEHNDATPWSEGKGPISDPHSFGGHSQSLRKPDILKTPVWVLDRDGVVHVTLPVSAY